ncbi:molybdate ABC transporter substrate-binding protein [Citricoccus sp. NPDC055426]|uniref:molybdate ABC transporter substrate-binding protein n=1 Tax=Citricoccus sp. NPDC055426 TaxID=3155536 RepID=UPI00343C3FD8
MRTVRATAPLAALALTALALTGCAGADLDAGETDATLTVFAAASLGEAFEELADGFEAEHPGVEVEYSFAGSSSLVEQILAGAPADVFASANEVNMTKVTDAGEGASAPELFATNVLTLITPPDNPAGIQTLEDAAAEDVKLVVCAPQVPCGDASAALAADAGVELAPVSEESQVTDVLGKITSGEADAGLVYVTDATGAGDAVRSVPLENAGSAVNNYPISVLRAAEENGAGQPELAQDFIDYVRSEDGQSLLEDHGFGQP